MMLERGVRIFFFKRLSKENSSLNDNNPHYLSFAHFYELKLIIIIIKKKNFWITLLNYR